MTAAQPPLQPRTRLLRFVRHGATAMNLAGVRCGGDVDVPLSDVGRQQAAAAARCIANLHPPVGIIVSSDLQRTKETANIILATLLDLQTDAPSSHDEPVRVLVLPQFAERFLGSWNGQPRAHTQAALEAGQTPPGGESNAAFKTRIAQAVQQLEGLWPLRPLLVSSQGVARVLGEMTGLPTRLRVANAQLAELDLTQALCDAYAHAPEQKMLEAAI